MGAARRREGTAEKDEGGGEGAEAEGGNGEGDLSR